MHLRMRLIQSSWHEKAKAQLWHSLDASHALVLFSLGDVYSECLFVFMSIPGWIIYAKAPLLSNDHRTNHMRNLLCFWKVKTSSVHVEKQAGSVTKKKLLLEPHLEHSVKLISWVYLRWTSDDILSLCWFWFSVPPCSLLLAMTLRTNK